MMVALCSMCMNTLAINRTDIYIYTYIYILQYRYIDVGYQKDHRRSSKHHFVISVLPIIYTLHRTPWPGK